MDRASFTVRSILLFLPIIALYSCSPKVTHHQNETISEKINHSEMITGAALKITVPLDDSSFLNGIYPVDDQGYVFIPIIGSIQVRNKSIDSLRRLIRSSLEQYMRYPEFEVRQMIRASLQGGFVKPGFYYIEPEYSMWELIGLAGGTTSESGLKKMEWKRDNRIISDNIITHIESGKSLNNIGFHSGDQLYTPVDTRTFREIFVSTVLPILTLGVSIVLGVVAIATND